MHIDLSNLTDGFSSKFRVISFFLAIIKINKLNKKLYIYEKKTRDCPYLFTDLCLIKKFKIVKLKKKPNTEIKFTPYNYNSELKKLKNKYSISGSKNRNFNLVSNLSYKNFVPNNKVKKKIDKISLPKNFIGIHIRSTDREIKIKNLLRKIQFEEMIFDFQIKQMISNLSSFIQSKTNINNIFISSDDKSYKDKIYFRLKNSTNIYYNKSIYKTKNFRQTNGEDFLTELFCLSKSKIIISTLGGAVPDAACLISKKKIKLYKWTSIINFYIFYKYLILVIFNLKKLKSKLFNFLLLKS